MNTITQPIAIVWGDVTCFVGCLFALAIIYGTLLVYEKLF